jgi:NACHT domain
MVDPVVTAVATKVFSDGLSKLTTNLLDATGGKLRSLLTTRNSSLRNHLNQTFERCTKIKTLLHRDEATNLLNLYVNLKFKCGDQVIDDYDLIDQIRARKKVVITGTGGEGKTVFMKYLWISLFENPRGKIPVFVELRRLNEFTSDKLDLYIYHSIIDHPSALLEKEFDQAIQAGIFVLILDGFDEIVADKRAALENQILDWAHRNPELTIVVSGRPDDRFAAWQLFSTFHVHPFNKSQIVDLVGKLNFDPVIKKKFIQKIKQNLFSQHQSFLSNPLLTTMMLLTFDQFADIPEKVNVFYEQAFDTLFSKHDATKEAYRRKIYSNCSIDVFKRYLSYFCLASYYDEKFEFTETEALNYIDKGLKVENSTIRSSDFLLDLVESVCLLRRDGLTYTFTHRSFQEFFVAYCLARVTNAPAEEVLPKIARRPMDAAIAMLFEMDKDLVETRYMVPKLKMLNELMGDPSQKNFVEKYCKLMVAELRIVVFDRDYIELPGAQTDWRDLVRVLYRLYSRLMTLKDADLEKLSNLNLTVVKQHVINKRKRRMVLIATVDIDQSGHVRLLGQNVPQGLEAKLHTIDHPEFNEPALWFHKTGIYQRYMREVRDIPKVLEEIEKSRTRKNTAIDELLKLK